MPLRRSPAVTADGEGDNTYQSDGEEGEQASPSGPALKRRCHGQSAMHVGAALAFGQRQVGLQGLVNVSSVPVTRSVSLD